MSFLLRVTLPNVPGSLGKVASAIGGAGGDIDAIQIVEITPTGYAVDDVLLNVAPGSMPDSIVSACNALADVEVLWISRYAVGGTLSLDLEAVESMTTHPDRALEYLVDIVPLTFRADWAARVRQSAASGGCKVIQATESSPMALPWPGSHLRRLDLDDQETLAVAAPLGKRESLVVGRRGGPAFLDSELARLNHLVALASSIARSSSPLS
ncbi:MAG: amino acid-binding protein [Nocardioides sp.]